jgi:hypothetical protein
MSFKVNRDTNESDERYITEVSLYFLSGKSGLFILNLCQHIDYLNNLTYYSHSE